VTAQDLDEAQEAVGSTHAVFLELHVVIGKVCNFAATGLIA
jgi:hypothetical protein